MSKRETKFWRSFVLSTAMTWTLLFIAPSIGEWDINPANWNRWVRHVYGFLCCISAIGIFYQSYKDWEESNE